MGISLGGSINLVYFLSKHTVESKITSMQFRKGIYDFWKRN